MEVRLTAEQEEFIHRAVAEGRYQSPEAAVQDALAQWQEEERARAELIASLEEADADFEAGRFSEYTDETLPDLFEEIKREGRALLDARSRK